MPLRDVTLSEIKGWRASLDPDDRVDERGGLPAAALDPPGSRGGGADRPGAAEDPRRRHGAGEAGRRAGHARRDRRHRRRDARAPAAAHRARCVRRPAGRRAARAAPVRRRRHHRPDRRRPARSTRRPTGRPGACPECGRPISAPKTASGVRTVHVPPPFLPMLQQHLLEHTAEDRTACSSPATAPTT